MPKGVNPQFECDELPCIYVVHDVRRKRIAVFIETSDGTVYMPLKKFEHACARVSELRRMHYKEASYHEVDELARKYLDLEPVDDYD